MGRAIIAAPMTLGMLCTLFVCWASLNLHRVTLGPFLNWLGNLGITAGRGIFRIDVHPFRFAHRLNVSIQKVLAQGIAMAERGFVKFLNQAVEPFLLAAGVTLALGLTAYEGFKALWHEIGTITTRTIPRTVVKPLRTVIKSTSAITRAQYNRLVHRVDVLAARVARAAHATAGAIATPFPRIGRLEREVASEAKRLGKMEKTLAAGVGAAFLVRALSRLGMGWLRCKNVTKTGKRLCGMNPDLLDSLLGATLLLTSAISLREFARELEEPTQLVRDGLQKLIREL